MIFVWNIRIVGGNGISGIKRWTLTFASYCSWCQPKTQQSRPPSACGQVSVPAARFGAPLIVFARGAQVPGLDDPALGGVDVVLRLDLLDPDLDAVLCEDDVLLAHSLRRGVLHLGDADVDLVADPTADAQEGEDDEEGEDLAAKGGQRDRDWEESRIEWRT